MTQTLKSMPGVPSSFFLLVVRPGAPSSLLVPSSKLTVRQQFCDPTMSGRGFAQHAVPTCLLAVTKLQLYIV